MKKLLILISLCLILSSVLLQTQAASGLEGDKAYRLKDFYTAYRPKALQTNDGNFIIYEFGAYKYSAEGKLLWKIDDRTNENRGMAVFFDAVVGSDGSICFFEREDILNIQNKISKTYSIFKIDKNGKFVGKTHLELKDRDVW